MNNRPNEKKQQELNAENFARKALTAISRKPVSETKIRALAKKVSKTMAEVLERA
jgi:hypothetical protein